MFTAHALDRPSLNQSWGRGSILSLKHTVRCPPVSLMFWGGNLRLAGCFPVCLPTSGATSWVLCLPRVNCFDWQHFVYSWLYLRKEYLNQCGRIHSYYSIISCNTVWENEWGKKAYFELSWMLLRSWKSWMVLKTAIESAAGTSLRVDSMSLGGDHKNIKVFYSRIDEQMS